MSPTDGPAEGGPAALPVVQSLFDPAGLRALVEVEYDVGVPTDCRLWVAGYSDVYAVATERARYFLRLHRAGWRSDGDVAYELDAVRHLADRGFPVALPVCGRDGAWFRTVAAPEGPRQLTLFARAPGREAYGAPGYARCLGRSMAVLHNASEGFGSSHPRFSVDLATLLDRPLDRLEPFFAERPDDWRYLRDLATRLRRGVDSLVPGLTWGFCHGDALGSNAHLEGDVNTGTLTHFDFDDCGAGWRAYDLATFRWICAWKYPDADARWDDYLRAYCEHRPITDADLAAVPLLVAIRELWVAGQSARVAAIRGHWLAQFAHRLRFLREWDERHLIV